MMAQRPWRASSHSNVQANCVEVATHADGVFVRDSKDPSRMTGFSRPAWAAFVKEVRR